MKNRLCLFTFFLACMLISCNSQNTKTQNLKGDLIKLLIENPKLQPSKTNGKITILKTNFCKDFDCENFFKDYQDQIQLYTLEDAFMRGISNYVEIKKIDEANGKILLSKKTKGQFEEMEIGIE